MEGAPGMDLVWTWYGLLEEAVCMIMYGHDGSYGHEGRQSWVAESSEGVAAVAIRWQRHS